jgi:hypothetical protein
MEALKRGAVARGGSQGKHRGAGGLGGDRRRLGGDRRRLGGHRRRLGGHRRRLGGHRRRLRVQEGALAVGGGEVVFDIFQVPCNQGDRLYEFWLRLHIAQNRAFEIDGGEIVFVVFEFDGIWRGFGLDWLGLRCGLYRLGLGLGLGLRCGLYRLGLGLGLYRLGLGRWHRGGPVAVEDCQGLGDNSL